MTIKGSAHAMYDLVGKDATLFHHSADPTDETGRRYVEEAHLWFDMMWNTVSREYIP